MAISVAAMRVVGLCARLLAQGHPLEVVVLAQNALRAGTVPACSLLGGQLHLLVARALHALGLHAAAAAAHCDGSWVLALHGAPGDQPTPAMPERPLMH